MAETRIPIKPDQRPAALRMIEVDIESALVSLADQLQELASRMMTISDVECSLSIDRQTGRASLVFRACR